MPGSGGEHRDPGGCSMRWQTGRGISGLSGLEARSLPVSGPLTLACVPRRRLGSAGLPILEQRFRRSNRMVRNNSSGRCVRLLFSGTTSFERPGCS